MTEQESDAGEKAPAVYVYGVVPADVEVKESATGVGSPPGPLATVVFEDIAALVSEIDPAAQLGTPDDLRIHADILDNTATVAPVLPFRFGAVMTNQDAVVSELLEPFKGEFMDALEQLEGFAEYIVKGRYVEDAILREIVSENDDAVRLRDTIREQPEDATREERLALGELISGALAAKRDADTQHLVEVLEPLATAVLVREPTHDEDSGSVAVLLSLDKVSSLDDAVAQLVQDWQGRVDITVLGPLAAYDFVKTRAPGT
ncbi:GvpL/GvpF family gas vesicle protein [Rhodococcus sp. KBS0724]|jgi:hypothetical protein|uniref:GvpL/GvpF family gas vesicle protein n=1 Tax=Rhodococcus sp. KBS0724 TaxID=1179674 RepID=UPI00110D9023|nr:GvpL/GvpF family gas vesicle protein [Rhodococcus sp. KBS0724]TSD49019.1 GvpL/GvpF family gas vesicle protein [Rhodococcus sp. KBS0724]